MRVVSREEMSAADVEIVTAEQEPATPAPTETVWQEVQIPTWGIRTVLPQSWQPLGNGAATPQAWSDGGASFVNFSATPGIDGQSILAQMVGTGTQEGMTSDQISMVNLGGRNWSIYVRHYGQGSLSAAVTTEDGMAYIISLSTAPEAQTGLLQTILENFTLLRP
jgi:hypothetical protein